MEKGYWIGKSQGTQTANKHMKSCSTSLVIREMPTKTKEILFHSHQKVKSPIILGHTEDIILFSIIFSLFVKYFNINRFEKNRILIWRDSHDVRQSGCVNPFASGPVSRHVKPSDNSSSHAENTRTAIPSGPGILWGAGGLKAKGVGARNGRKFPMLSDFLWNFQNRKLEILC